MINKTFEELGEYRGEDGYIDLDRVLSEHELETEREVRGNENREKDWIKINGGKVLVKTNVDGQQNSEYSELISCELAKQAGLETAEYDMVRYKGEQGLITKHVCKEGEEIITLHELIGSGPDVPGYEDTIDIKHVFNSLPAKLKEQGFSEQDIDECMLSLRKQLLFDLTVMEADRHLENISVIFSKVDGKQTVRLAPMYDTEAALLLGNDPEVMKRIYPDWMKTASLTTTQPPKISMIPENKEEDVVSDLPPALMGFLAQLRSEVKTNAKEEFTSDTEEMWMTTFDFLCEDERAREFFETNLKGMNIRQALEEVEKKTGAKVPEHIRGMAIACFEDRVMAMDYRNRTKSRELGRDVRKIDDEDGVR